MLFPELRPSACLWPVVSNSQLVMGDGGYLFRSRLYLN